MARKYHITFDRASFMHLVTTWYREKGRTMQAVHPRDILKSVVTICEYEGIQPHLSPDLVDEACMGYFVDA